VNSTGYSSVITNPVSLHDRLQAVETLKIRCQKTLAVTRCHSSQLQPCFAQGQKLRDVPVDFAWGHLMFVHMHRQTTVVSELWSSLKSRARTVPAHYILLCGLDTRPTSHGNGNAGIPALSSRFLLVLSSSRTFASSSSRSRLAVCAMSIEAN